MRYAFFAVGQTRERVRRWPGARSSGTRGPAASFFNWNHGQLQATKGTRKPIRIGAPTASCGKL